MPGTIVQVHPDRYPFSDRNVRSRVAVEIRGEDLIAEERIRGPGCKCSITRSAHEADQFGLGVGVSQILKTIPVIICDGHCDGRDPWVYRIVESAVAAPVRQEDATRRIIG